MKYIRFLFFVLNICINFCDLKASTEKNNLNINLKNLNAQLLDASFSGDKERIVSLLEEGADVNAFDNKQVTVLMNAVASGDLNIIALVLQKGANIYAVNKWKETALMCAISDDPKYKDIVALLLQSGADIHVADDGGETALMYAARPRYEEIMELLLKNRTNINAVDNEHKTALMKAVRSGAEKVVELLLQSGADVNVVDNKGETALMYAVGSESIAIIALLLKYKANVKAIDNDGNTALSLSQNIRTNKPEIIKLLKDCAAFTFVKINQKFDKEPELKNYIEDKRVFVQETGNDQENKQNKAKSSQEAFQKDFVAYWRDKVQKAYEEFAFQNNLVPLRTLLTQELYEKQTLIPTIANFFSSRNDFLEIQNKIKSSAVGEDLNRLQEMINNQKAIEEKTDNFEKRMKIHHVFKQQK